MKKVIALIASFAWMVACRDASVSPAPANNQAPTSITVSTSAFAAGAPIPEGNTCHGADLSPQLSWTAVPTTARSIAIVVDDPDAPSGTFTHWIVWNIKPEARMLGANANGGLEGGIVGTNDFDHTSYNGPCPPKGKVHHYRFNVYGLDAELTLKPRDKRRDLDAAMNHHVVAQGTLTGTYEAP